MITEGSSSLPHAREIVFCTPLVCLSSQTYNFSDSLFGSAQHLGVNSGWFISVTLRTLQVLAARVFAVAEGCTRGRIYNGAFILKINRI